MRSSRLPSPAPGVPSFTRAAPAEHRPGPRAASRTPHSVRVYIPPSPPRSPRNPHLLIAHGPSKRVSGPPTFSAGAPAQPPAAHILKLTRSPRSASFQASTEFQAGPRGGRAPPADARRSRAGPRAPGPGRDREPEGGVAVCACAGSRPSRCCGGEEPVHSAEAAASEPQLAHASFASEWAGPPASPSPQRGPEVASLPSASPVAGAGLKASLAPQLRALLIQMASLSMALRW